MEAPWSQLTERVAEEGNRPEEGCALPIIGRVLQRIGAVALTLAALPLILQQADLVEGTGMGPRPSAFVSGVWCGLGSIYGVVFWWTVGRLALGERGVRTWCALGAQTAMWLAMFWLTGSGYHMARTQLLLGAVQLGMLASVGPGLGFVLLMGLLQSVVGLRHYTMEREIFAYLTLLVPYGFAGFLASHLVAKEVLARNALARKNDELESMHATVAENQRLDERLRIARELHDLVGHHLTALSLRLEVAGHMVDDGARDQVRKCHDITRQLLKDVREVVGSLRSDPIGPSPPTNFLSTLRALTEGIETPRVHLRGRGRLDALDSQTEHIVIRCVQEIITNAVRHSHADNLWIRLSSSGRTLYVYACDDGIGSRGVRGGYGLRGMTERVERVGGRLKIMASPARGFRLALAFPLTGVTP